MNWINPIQELWPLLVALGVYFIHTERRLSRIETNIKWLINNNKKGGETK